MFEILNNKKVRIILGALLALIILSNTSLAENSNQFASFDGTSKSIIFNGNNSNVQFEANNLFLTTNFTSYSPIKNVTIQYNNGETELINYAHSIRVQYLEDGYQTFQNVDLKMSMYNLSMTKYWNYNRIDIDGHVNYGQLKLNGMVYLQKNAINYAIIDDMNITDFNQIFFKIDNTSTVYISNNKIKINAYTASDLNIEGTFSRIYLNQVSGKLRLNNQKFDVESDTLDVVISPNYQDTSFLEIENNNIIFNGLTNSTKLNNENIILEKYDYWFENEPDKIIAIAAALSAISALFLLILTAFNLISTRKLLSMETDKKKHEKQRFLNILLAELETNSLLLDDLKKSVQTIIDDISKIIDFEILNFRDNGFNTFRNQGGFEYISSELYSELVDYYNRIYRIGKKFDISDDIKMNFTAVYIKTGEPIQDIESIETLTNNLKTKLKDEIQKTIETKNPYFQRFVNYFDIFRSYFRSLYQRKILK